jgi:hypothetical protein
MNHRMRGGAPSTTPVFIAYIDPARFLERRQAYRALLASVGTERVIQKIIWISDYCGGLMASIPEWRITTIGHVQEDSCRRNNHGNVRLTVPVVL